VGMTLWFQSSAPPAMHFFLNRRVPRATETRIAFPLLIQNEPAFSMETSLFHDTLLQIKGEMSTDLARRRISVAASVHSVLSVAPL
jgi:hypothetical protein